MAPLLVRRISSLAEFVLEVLKMRPFISVTVYLVPAGALSMTTALLVDRTLTLLFRLIAVLMPCFGSGFALTL